jgi:DNA-binding transcriptional LysR family regulator
MTTPVSRIELNLFAVFEAVMIERNVTRAAARLAMTQPSVSNALQRLRRLIGDPLFRRAPGGVEPTERALALYPEVRTALQLLRGSVAPRQFEPATARGAVTIGLSDVLARRVVPDLAVLLERDAPGVDLRVRPFGSVPFERALATGVWDMTLAAGRPRSPDLLERELGAVEYVLVAGAHHPAGDAIRSGAFGTAEYAALRHVLVTPEGDPRGFADEALEASGLGRRIAVTVNQFGAALDVVRRTALVALISPLALPANRDGLVVGPAPIAVAPVRLRLIWHARQDTDPLQRWFRTRILEIAAQAKPSYADNEQ